MNKELHRLRLGVMCEWGLRWGRTVGVNRGDCGFGGYHLLGCCDLVGARVGHDVPRGENSSNADVVAGCAVPAVVLLCAGRGRLPSAVAAALLPISTIGRAARGVKSRRGSYRPLTHTD